LPLKVFLNACPIFFLPAIIPPIKPTPTADPAAIPPVTSGLYPVATDSAVPAAVSIAVFFGSGVSVDVVLCPLFGYILLVIV
jgi:hypothetical protein